MTTVPPPGILTLREEWNDADFDFPDGDPIQASDAESEKEEDAEEEDWDVEMDLGKTGGAKVQTVVRDIAAAAQGSSCTGDESRMFAIRPPLTSVSDEDEDDDGVPTIKASILPEIPNRGVSEATIDEDIEDGFALPSDLTRLSLRPLELNHRSSKSSLEWGDKDHTTSSQSSDAYSMFSFADHSPPSTVYTSASQPETETEDEEEVEDLLDGLVIPNGLFESGQDAKKLTRMLETKKKAVITDMRVKIASPDPEDDFESGLVFGDDMELCSSRLLQAGQQTTKLGLGATSLRSKSVPRTSTSGRTRSHTKSDRAKSPNIPPVSSSRQLRKLTSPSPKPSSSSLTQTYSQAVTSAPALSTKSSFLAPKYSSLRGQKSHTVLKAPSPSSSRGLSRKASLPSLTDHSPTQATSSRASDMPTLARYDAPTASSKAKSHANSTGRLQTLDHTVPPTRPSTPSSNPAALRLTMPTSSSRLKVRTSISNVFPPSPASTISPLLRSTSPLPAAPRPPSALSGRSSSSKSRHIQAQSMPAVPAVRVLKRPKRTRTYGDGTELDGIEDLPLDREKEGKYRVQPKGSGTRIPGASYAYILLPSLSRKPPSSETTGSKILKRTSRVDFSSAKVPESASRATKRKVVSSPRTMRKPTLIRNLGGSGAPKVVGEMKWNPQTLRWEGNDQVLRDFDAAVGTSTRPALITHLTGSSIGSPVNSIAAGARKVGNMIFDPAKMCWISTLPPEEDEPDVFANLADDEDEVCDANARTIRTAQQLSATACCNTPQANFTPGSSVTRTRSRSESESDRGSRASMVCDVEEDFLDKCHAAEIRHRTEMRGWTTTSAVDRSFLYEIRALATRQY
ncbi:uncharacterized protein PHACADRAFT_247681 [Phanerochaete carnosa HHB-10118-sp]|uniref:Protein byr4 n=1 Tax=Phanerochaete carnosa (strain HHB-10118-sp) TaxID=650164 RepID=K5VDZ4_PHACS|nr:uncharacterized protein PHACADRAFT_247681 [Phanerochaete carnosa HHB-10118-sp]EKM61216.1 hypothetical protein PHACADRAFT_247681 [Phanerochaete carnosa HHB-10118-sp]